MTLKKVDTEQEKRNERREGVLDYIFSSIEDEISTAEDMLREHGEDSVADNLADLVRPDGPIDHLYGYAIGDRDPLTDADQPKES